MLNNFISFCSSKEWLKKMKAEIEQEKKIKEELQRGNDKTSPTKSDDSGYLSANSFDDDPMVEQLCHQLLLSGETQYQSNLSSYLVSNWSKSLSISGGDSSCSWVLVRALGLIVKEEFKSVMLGGGWRCGGAPCELQYLHSNSKNSQVSKSVPLQKHPHWKNTNTQLQYSLYCYSLDWW